MGEDKREAILERLCEVYEGLVETTGCVLRNTTNVPESKLPAIILLDGDESADESAYGRGRPANGPVIMVLQPESYVILQENRKEVGPLLSQWRDKLIKAVLQDQTLVALCHNGDIRFEGFETALAAGRSMSAEARISFSFRYVLRPARL